MRLRWSSALAAGGRGGRRGGGDEAPRRIPDGGPPDVAHRSARGKNVEGFIRRAMETTAVTATARGGNDGDDGDGDDNDDNGAIAMVINLDLCTAGVQRYVAHLTGGMAVSFFFQGGGGVGGCRGGEEKTRTTMRTTWHLPR